MYFAAFTHLSGEKNLDPSNDRQRDPASFQVDFLSLCRWKLGLLSTDALALNKGGFTQPNPSLIRHRLGNLFYSASKPTQVPTVDKQDFWRYWNNIDLPSFPKYTNIQLFKHDIPSYNDDPSFHDNGGKWVITQSSREDAQRMWLLCILALIGEQFEHHSELHGTVLSFGPRKCLISIWNRSWENKLSIGTTEQELSRFLELASGSIRYQTHQGMLDLGRRKIGIKLSASLDLGSATTSNNRLDDKKTDDGKDKERGDSKSRRFSGIEDDDFSTPFIELSQLDKPQAPPAPPAESSALQQQVVGRLHPGQSPGHRRSQSAGQTSSVIRCQADAGKISSRATRVRGNGSEDGRRKPMDLETQKRFAASTDAECSFGSALSVSPNLPPKHRRRGKKRSLDAADQSSAQARIHRSSVSNLPSQRFKIVQETTEENEKEKENEKPKVFARSKDNKLSKIPEEGNTQKAVPSAGSFNVKILIPFFVLLVALFLMIAYAQDAM